MVPGTEFVLTGPAGWPSAKAERMYTNSVADGCDPGELRLSSAVLGRTAP